MAPSATAAITAVAAATIHPALERPTTGTGAVRRRSGDGVVEFDARVGDIAQP